MPLETLITHHCQFQEGGGGGGEGKEVLPYPPVCQLKLFVHLDVAAILKKKGERVFWQAKDPTRLSCVKHVHYVETKVSLEPLDVHVCSMEYLSVHVLNYCSSLHTQQYTHHCTPIYGSIQL